jgi:PEGA domain
MPGATMPSARRPDSWIVLSDPTRSRPGTDAPAIRDDQPLSEFTSEMAARSNVETSVTVSAGSTGLKIAPGHLLNFTVHERTSIPSTSPARVHASARRELIESLTAQVRDLRARVARMPKVPMWIGQVRNLRRLPANTALSFAGGIATGVLIMWFATTPPSTIVPSATPAPAQEPAVLAMGLPALPLDPHSAQENVRTRSTSQPPAIVSPVVTSGRRNDVVDQRARPSRAKSTPAAARKNAASSPLATRSNTSPGFYRGSLVLRSAPEGARVFVNGTLVGSTPLILEDLPVGSRAVRIEADGYQHWSASTQVVADKETHLSATLAPAAP